MKVMQAGSITWKQGLLSLEGWQIDLEGEEYSQRQLEKAAARCCIEVMMEDVGIDIEGKPSFDVECLAADVIFVAQVTSWQVVNRGLDQKWYTRWMWWKR